LAAWLLLTLKQLAITPEVSWPKKLSCMAFSKVEAARL
jgi:hypothetical protein